MAVRFRGAAVHDQAVRYVAAGVLNTGIYVGLTLLLSGPLGVPIQIAIVAAFVTALCTHFLLQRFFVFRSRSEFHLTAKAQAARYVVIGAIQYAIVATTTAVVPGLLDVPEQAVYVGVVGVVSAVTFMLLRGRVFHAHVETLGAEP